MNWARFCEINSVRKAYLHACIEDLNSNVSAAKIFLKKPFSILLVGEPGTGKTFFMYALIRELFEKNWPLHEVRFINGKRVGDMFEEEHRTYGTTKNAVRQLMEPAILFVDDFGVEGKSDRVERNYYEILDNRLADEMPTLLSTNLTDPELREVFGARIDSRLKQCIKLHFEGPDQRQAKPIF